MITGTGLVDTREEGEEEREEGGQKAIAAKETSRVVKGKREAKKNI
jgi:hypothetical protein